MNGTNKVLLLSKQASKQASPEPNNFKEEGLESRSNAAKICCRRDKQDDSLRVFLTQVVF